MIRCPWCEGHELYKKYHDEEWGVPEWDSRQLFEKLILDGAQAGLSWWIILSKRDNYRVAFDQFDPYKMARYDDQKRIELLSNPGIVRNRLKINAAITNARSWINMEEKGHSFSDFLWDYVDGRPINNQFVSMGDLPATSHVSNALSKELKKRGFKFVGSTIVYAFMQAVGMVNDHLVSCHRYPEIMKLH